MILVDTSVWIEFFRKSDPEIDERLSAYLENGQVVICSMVFGELLQGVGDEREEKAILEFLENLPRINETNLLIEAGKVSYRHKLFTKGVGLIDAAILVAAINLNLEVWTLDKKLMQVLSQFSQ